ncbi:hypothetical protein [Haliangium sp.]|uniref:hypothetical protein n=1 Tax=Haliangium sp. TaxID=2663208 RepID=UPI003D128489
MRRCTALYSKSHRSPTPRTRFALHFDDLLLTFPDGRWQQLHLHGCRTSVADATRERRFVRHMSLRMVSAQVDLITPPEQGAIAPRAAGLPVAPAEAGVVDDDAWETLADWMISGGRMGRRTVAELAHLARVATPYFASVIGAHAARVAAELVWERCGPMRDSGGDLGAALEPLVRAAECSPRAADALVAARSALGVAGRPGS